MRLRRCRFLRILVFKDAWWVDHLCSGVIYAVDILIMGPEGLPYW